MIADMLSLQAYFYSLCGGKENVRKIRIDHQP